MKTLDSILDKIMRGLMAVSMLSLVVGGFWQVFSRWVLSNPSTFTEEFMRYMLIWAGMIGSAYCFYKNQHLALALFRNKARGGVKVALQVLTEVAIVFFVSYVFIYGGFRMASNATNTSPVLRIPFTVLYQILPLSGCFIARARILDYIKMFSVRGNKEEGGAN